MGNEKARPTHYATELTVHPDGEQRQWNFFARVKLMPVGINEYSQGHGGFMLTGRLRLADGSTIVIHTDKTWNCRLNRAYKAPFIYDGRIKPDPYETPEEIQNIWHCVTAPIPPRCEEVLVPYNRQSMTVPPHGKAEAVFLFDKIYAGFVSLTGQAQGELALQVQCFELEDQPGSEETCILDGAAQQLTYRGLQLHSVGGYRIIAENRSDNPAQVIPQFISTHYPAAVCAKTTTSDPAVDKILEVCAHTLKICRQMIHLDSPRHSEPLACTGDYYIESLMTAFTYGDMRLAAFDVRRTAELLLYNDGRIFHTTYSLIWVLMLRDVYQYTGDAALLSDCADALALLLKRFEGYLGENGILETPPDFMFVDWIYIDGISLHHPPKALGQTCLNAYYYGALKAAEKIYGWLNDSAAAQHCAQAANCLRQHVNELLFDKEKELYFEGLNTPTPEKLLMHYMPQNVNTRYYRKHANILAANFGLCDPPLAKKLLERVMEDDTLGDYQPYFAHFLLEALFKNGLRDRYTLPLIRRWYASVEACDKGLAEGWIQPEPGYRFDHSHAWGGTPAYSLPKALLGFEMLKPGFQKIRLSPSLLGLNYATVELPTPYGMLRCHMEKGKAPALSIPAGLEVVIEEN